MRPGYAIVAPMQTSLPESFKNSESGKRADRILRSCVHCGFCNATCPTYQLTGDELDGPRGRIYLIKQLLEGNPSSLRSLQHLDRCLTCRACESTCPSGVDYARLLDIGRRQFESQVRRPWRQRLLRNLLRFVLPYPRRVALALGLSPLLQPFIPTAIKQAQPQREPVRLPAVSNRSHGREVLLLDGCVQAATRPNIKATLSRVLGTLTTVPSNSMGWLPKRSTKNASCAEFP